MAWKNAKTGDNYSTVIPQSSIEETVLFVVVQKSRTSHTGYASLDGIISDPFFVHTNSLLAEGRLCFLSNE